MATKPVFIDTDIQAVQQERKAAYESSTGKTLLAAQPEQLLINAGSYREALLRQGIQEAALQNLVEFATAPILDEHAKLVGVTRIPAQQASTMLQFSLTPGHTGGRIPSGTRVASIDGKVVFVLDSNLDFLTGATTANGNATADVGGEIGNGYNTGTITSILDGSPFVVSVQNTTVSDGGSEEETDEQLRQRIQLAPNSFSVAGSRGAYKFWAKSAHPDVIDVGLDVPTPGTVTVYILTPYPDTVASPAVLSAVEAVLTDEKIRPMCDTVNVVSANASVYDIEIDVTKYAGYNDAALQAEILANLEAFTQEKRRALGKNITDTQIIAAAMQGLEDKVYDIEMVGWSDLNITDESEFASIGTITINMVGYNNG